MNTIVNFPGAQQLGGFDRTQRTAYAGASSPWMGLGTNLEPSAPLDHWQKAAGLDWNAIATMPLYQTGDGTGLKPFPEKRVLYRSDTQAPLSVVSDGYQIVQPGEVLEFYRDLVADQGFQMETVGMLQGGRKIWALAKVGDGFTLPGNDLVLPYCLLATSFDGSMATRATLTSIRVVCQNTLQVALNSKNITSVSIPHSTKFDERSVKLQMGLFGSGWTVFERTASELAKRTVSQEEAIAFMLQAANVKLAEGMTFEDIKSRKFKKLIEVATTAPGQHTASAQNTAWGLLNAITRYVDHEAPSRTADTRLNGAWFGGGATQKVSAFAAAVKLLKEAA